MLTSVDHVDLEKPTTIVNPTSYDFTCTYDLNRDGNPVSYTIKSRESATYPYKIAIHVAKHLTKFIVNKLSGVKTQALKKKTFDSLFV